MPSQSSTARCAVRSVSNFTRFPQLRRRAQNDLLPGLLDAGLRFDIRQADLFDSSRFSDWKFGSRTGYAIQLSKALFDLDNPRSHSVSPIFRAAVFGRPSEMKIRNFSSWETEDWDSVYTLIGSIREGTRFQVSYSFNI